MCDVFCDSGSLSDAYGEGEHYRHCVHDCIHNGDRSGICCHCGDIFLANDEPNDIEHGEYAPGSEAIIARLTRELAAARAMVPTQDEADAISYCAKVACRDLVEESTTVETYLERLEAARVEGEGKP